MYRYREVTSHSTYRANQKQRFCGYHNSKAIGKLAWHLAGAPGAWCFLCRTHSRRKEINKSKPLCARAPAFLCANMTNPATAKIKIKKTNLLRPAIQEPTNCVDRKQATAVTTGVV